MKRLLLLLPSTSYRAADFLIAAERLGVAVVVGSNERQALESVVPGKTITLDFADLKGAAEKVVDFAKDHPIDAVVSADEESIVLAATISEALSLPHNPVSATAAAKDKHRLREVLTAASLPTPPFQLFSTDDPPEVLSQKVFYPCVLKPTFLSASRGVIRANHPDEFVAAFYWLSRILKEPEVKRLGGDAAKQILVEDFIPGKEVALEGLLREGHLSALALFDKPDPLDGPFFEETIYVTPSRLPPSMQEAITECTGRAAAALGLKEGPIHAELRVNERGPWIIELAARSIGGICSRALRFGVGLTLEEIILRHALGMPIESLERERPAAGVMMIPIPASGTLLNYQGVEEAKKVPGIVDVKITIHRKQKVIPLPEGRRYLGFIFARAPQAEQVEAALRDAHRKLKFEIVPFK
ncbi:ATP-grasp domain-containing protein [Candidatus Manganitrophus noduliformans]|uniref:ATP-grasp domain-containing protein n=1 Tax=Candidatus Manganitrophus noduliformans TaxID=2606439 RepID=A0A7X6DQT1_9BACT|nr:ATP-grasp domain-containing protein [Candidatus Manganitrophus noduliformans]NKE71373.1 ATP-grasp domain-containing protein [Candidatus Manganitrophus noduliformans]